MSQNMTTTAASLFANLVESTPADLGAIDDLAASLLNMADLAEADHFATVAAKARLADPQPAPQGQGDTAASGVGGAFAAYQARLAMAHGRLDARISLLANLSEVARAEAATARLIAGVLPTPLSPQEPLSCTLEALAALAARNDLADSLAHQSDAAAAPQQAAPEQAPETAPQTTAPETAAPEMAAPEQAAQQEVLTAQAALSPQDEAAPHSPLSPVLPSSEETTTYNGVEIPVVLTREAAQEMDAAQLKVYAQAHGVPYKVNASKARMLTALGF